MTALERCEVQGFDGVILFAGDSYDTALLGITEDCRAVYDFNKMVEWVMEAQGINQDAAMEWIGYNTIGDLPNMGPFGPIIMYPLNDNEQD